MGAYIAQEQISLACVSLFAVMLQMRVVDILVLLVHFVVWPL